MSACFWLLDCRASFYWRNAIERWAGHYPDSALPECSGDTSPGGSRALDFLQPGRHTYAFFTALAVAGGAGIDELLQRARLGFNGVDHLDRWVMVGAAVLGIRIWGYPLVESLRVRLAPPSGEPFLSSRPSPQLLWITDRVKRYLQPGQRLLYEEGGKDLPGIRDPFEHGRFSGLLPERTGVEVIGGPYLHASLTTNFTQFGEGKLFGQANWDRNFFDRHAKLYRPSAILCWSPYARRFCLENSDLVEVLEDDGTFMFRRIVGFAGDFIEGAATWRRCRGGFGSRTCPPDLTEPCCCGITSCRI